MNAVLGFAQLLREDLGTPQLERQREYLGRIEQAGWGNCWNEIERMLNVCDREG